MGHKSKSNCPKIKRPDPIVEEIRNKNSSGISIPTLICGVQGRGGGNKTNNKNLPKFSMHVLFLFFLNLERGGGNRYKLDLIFHSNHAPVQIYNNIKM